MHQTMFNNSMAITKFIKKFHVYDSKQSAKDVTTALTKDSTRNKKA